MERSCTPTPSTFLLDGVWDFNEWLQPISNQSSNTHGIMLIDLLEIKMDSRVTLQAIQSPTLVAKQGWPVIGG